MSQMIRRTFVKNAALDAGGVIAGSIQITLADKERRRSMTDLRQALRGTLRIQSFALRDEPC